MSILGNTWTLKKQRNAAENLWSALMAARGVENPGDFFSSASLEDLHDPFLFPDMEKAVHRLLRARDQGEKVVVYGDYDVDGVSGSAILVHTLKEIGAQVSYRIPHRLTQGYGVHQSIVEELVGLGAKILITVDCGISCPKEVEWAESHGLNVILTDHHAIPESVPQPYALLHPLCGAGDYPFGHLSGSGMAFKLASALWIKLGKAEEIRRFTDLASLGTVADCVPLHGENRTIVKLGLEQLVKTEWHGLKAILQSAGVWGAASYNSDTIGFQIGPRLNASGRMDSPYWAIQTLLATPEEAKEKSEKLELLNMQRRQRTLEIMEQAEATMNFSEPVLVGAHTAWSSGLVGLIAGKLQEKHRKPTFILEDQGEKLVGSVRSIPGFHARDVLQSLAHLLVGYGGHELAAGFHLEKQHFPAFQQQLLELAREKLSASPTRELTLDTELYVEDVTLENCEKVASFEPFGIGNLKPVFLMKNPTILEVKKVGAEGKHLKFTMKKDRQLVSGIAFGLGEQDQALWRASNLVVELEKNAWQDRETPQLRLVDFD